MNLVQERLLIDILKKNKVVRSCPMLRWYNCIMKKYVVG